MALIGVCFLGEGIPVRKRNLLASATLAAAAVMGTAAPASATDLVPCVPDNDWVKIAYIMSNGNPFAGCFANAGTIYLDLPRSYHLRAGNNSGYVEFIDSDGARRYRNFNHWENHSLGSVRAVKLRIY
jgi:hypothetical protein